MFFLFLFTRLTYTTNILICPSIDGLKYRAYLTDFDIVQGELKMQLEAEIGGKVSQALSYGQLGLIRANRDNWCQLLPNGAEWGRMGANGADWGGMWPNVAE